MLPYNLYPNLVYVSISRGEPAKHLNYCKYQFEGPALVDNAACWVSGAGLFTSFACFARFSSLSLYRSPKRSKCGRVTMGYLTNSSMQSTRRSLLPLGMSLLPASSSVNCLYAMGIELRFGITNIRIHRPSMRNELTVLKDCDPPFTCAMARVRP